MPSRFWLTGVLGLSFGLSAVACGSTTKCAPDDPRASCSNVTYSAGAGAGDAGSGGSGGRTTVSNAKCLTTTPCTTDSQCVAIAGTTCNTTSNKCQTVLCGDEGTICSADNHCNTGSVCAAGLCKYDPRPRCFKKPVCVEGNWTDDPQADCADMGGELRTSCPKGSNLQCTYMEGSERGVMYLYSSSDSEAMEFEQGCTFLKGKITTSL